MTARLKELCSLIPACGSLADVGCDHGYLAQHAIESGKCAKVYISDISEKSLQKAVDLLKGDIAAGRCVPVCCDGLSKVPPVECAVIAGLGGEEIVHILSRDGIPPRFVLQPMKNAEKVRAFLVERGCAIERDYTFEDGKFYDVITGRNTGGDGYSDFEIAYGRDNLKDTPPAFIKKVRKEQQKIRKRLECDMKRESREELRARLYALEVITDAFDGDL